MTQAPVDRIVSGSIGGFGMVSRGAQDNAQLYATAFQAATPFRHVVIEEFFESAFAHRLLSAFPAFAPERARNENGEVGRKAVHQAVRQLGPAFVELDAMVSSQAFLDLVSRITAIPGLLYDPDYFGGGTHDNRDGQSLDAHVDFNRHPITHTHRRLNLIVYLNPAWDPDWGGALELHRDPRASDDQVASVQPLFNRAVIFETTESSWHGFSPIRFPADGAVRARRSIALYFYTRDRPAEEQAATHSTVYVDRPLPARFAAGHALESDDVLELQALVAGRDQHIQRLYRDNQALQDKLESALRMVGLARGSRGYRLLQGLRRLLGRGPATPD